MPDHRVLHRARDRRSIHQLVTVDAGDGAAGDVTHVVHAGLAILQAHGVEALESGRDVPDAHPADLEVLARGDIDVATAVVIAQGADLRDLAGRQDAVGHAQAQGEVPRRLTAVENAIPLHALDVV